MPVQSDAVTIFLALFAMLGTIATLFVNAYILTRVGKVESKTAETHDLVNGMSTRLQAASSRADFAEGVTSGEEAQRQRSGPTTVSPAPVQTVRFEDAQPVTVEDGPDKT